MQTERLTRLYIESLESLSASADSEIEQTRGLAACGKLGHGKTEANRLVGELGLSQARAAAVFDDLKRQGFVTLGFGNFEWIDPGSERLATDLDIATSLEIAAVTRLCEMDLSSAEEQFHCRLKNVQAAIELPPLAFLLELQKLLTTLVVATGEESFLDQYLQTATPALCYRWANSFPNGKQTETAKIVVALTESLMELCASDANAQLLELRNFTDLGTLTAPLD